MLNKYIAMYLTTYDNIRYCIPKGEPTYKRNGSLYNNFGKHF